MSRPEGSHPDPALGHVAERVRELHHPARARILLELAGDVEALTSDLKERGISEEDAVRRATERVVPSGVALDALVRLHRPFYRRVSAPIADSRLRRWERGTLLLLTTLLLGGALLFLGANGLLASPSPFLWTVLVLSGGVLALALATSFRLFILKDHGPDTLDRGLGPLLWLSGIVLFVAGVGAVADLWGLSAAMEVGSQDPMPLLTAWLIRESVLLTTALLTALAGGLVWFLLARETAAIRGGDQDIREALEPSPTPRAAPHAATIHTHTGRD